MGHNRAGQRRKERRKRHEKEERRLAKNVFATRSKAFAFGTISSAPPADVDHNRSWLRGQVLADSTLLARLSRGRWLSGTDGTIRTRRRENRIEIEWIDENHPYWGGWNKPGSWYNSAFNPTSGGYFFRRDARRIEVLEEFLHNVQEKLGMLDLPYPRYEIKVKDFMIRHRRLLKISDNDAKVLRQMLVRQIEDSIEDTDRVPLQMPPSALAPIGSE
jgi:hypothetical protein